MASKMAWAGLLGEVANQGNIYLERERKLEERKILEAQERRKEEALLLRQKALAEFNYQLGAGERADAKSERSSARAQHMIEREEDIADKKEARKEAADERRQARAESAADRALNREYQNKVLGKESEYDKKVALANADETLTPEERKQAKYGITKRGEMTDYQKIRAEEGLAKLEAGGVDDTNVEQVNRYRSQLGLQPLKRNVKTPGEKGWFKDTPAEYEYRAGVAEPSGEEVVTTPGGGLDKYKSILQSSGTKDGIIEMGDKPTGESLLSSDTPAQAETQAQPTGEIITPEERRQMQKMTAPQLQAMKLGLLEDDPGVVNTPEGQAIIKEINDLIAKKRSLAR